VALNKADLTQAWQFKGDEGKGVWSTPLLVDETLYVASMNHFLFRRLMRRPGDRKVEKSI